MSAPAAEDAALRIGRFSLVVWLVGLLVLGGTMAFAAPRLLPHLFNPADDAGSRAGSAAEEAGASAPDPGEDTDGAGTAAQEPAPVATTGAGKYSGSHDATIDYQRPVGYNGPFEVAVNGGVDASVAVDDPENPDWPAHFLYNSADRAEPATGLLATARDDFTLHIEADGDWQLEVRPVPYADLTGGALSGAGPALVRYEGEEVLAEFTYSGDSNIAVYTWQESRRNLVVNKIGSSSTRFSWQPYPVTYFLVDTADGRWSFHLDG